MTGFLSADMSRDEMMMTGFSSKTSVRPPMNVPRPRRGCSRSGQRSSTSLWLAISGEGMLDDAFPLPFPAAQPAPALAGRREDIHARPDFGGCSSLKMLMRPEVIVGAARVDQGSIQRPSVLDVVLQEQPFDGSDEAFDAAVLPGASGIAELQTNPYVPQGQAKRLRCEDRFVVGAQESWAAVVTTGRGEMVPNRQRRLFRHLMHAQTGAAGMVHDGHDDMLPTDSIRFHQQIHAPNQVAGNRARHAMFQCPPHTQDGVVLSSDRVRDVGLADGHVAAFDETPVEAVDNRPTSRLRHEGFEADEFVSDPARFRRRMGISLSCNPAP